MGQTDWDALLVPVKRAWSKRMAAWAKRSSYKNGLSNPANGEWADGDGSAHTLLGELWGNSAWKKVANNQVVAPQGLAARAESGDPTTYSASEMNSQVFH